MREQFLQSPGLGRLGRRGGSGGPVTPPNIIAPGTFESGVEGFTNAGTGATVTAPGGVLRVTAGAGSCSASTALTGLTIGADYELDIGHFDPTTMGSGSARVRIENAPTIATGGGVVNQAYTAGWGVQSDLNFPFTATAETMYFGLRLTAVSGGEYAEMDNVSVKLVTYVLALLAGSALALSDGVTPLYLMGIA